MIYEQPHHTKHKHGQQNQTLFLRDQTVLEACDHVVIRKWSGHARLNLRPARQIKDSR